MRFDDLAKTLRIYETAHDFCVLPDTYIIVRLDGRGFTRLTKDNLRLERPFDPRFKEAMVKTTLHLMGIGFHVIYGYTQSDEISLLLHKEDNTFSRKTRKIISVLAGEASACFSLAMQSLACFDARISQISTTSIVNDYFRWRQQDAHRNALNAHCYWALRNEGTNVQATTAQLEGMSVADKNELLFKRGINFNDLPTWQKRGVGLRWESYEKEGFNPKTDEKVMTERREIQVNEELSFGDEYGVYIEQTLQGTIAS